MSEQRTEKPTFIFNGQAWAVSGYNEQGAATSAILLPSPIEAALALARRDYRHLGVPRKESRYCGKCQRRLPFSRLTPDRLRCLDCGCLVRRPKLTEAEKEASRI